MIKYFSFTHKAYFKGGKEEKCSTTLLQLLSFDFFLYKQKENLNK